MPRPTAPPTPASSTEIKGKDGSQFSSLQMSFELPPPAVAGSDSHASTYLARASSSNSNYHPALTPHTSPAIPASESVKIRRRSSLASAVHKDTFALPPPPTRSRKIIQMKPRGQPGDGDAAAAAAAAAAVAMSEHLSHPPSKPAPAASKKKQPSTTSVAGRKIARKTAHSLIERRRRSKMNEEFGVLKDMIPACTGEMHKLAILQASIDYVRYLEDCVAKLKAENVRGNSARTPLFEPAAMSHSAHGTSSYAGSHHERHQDEEMEMTSSSPTYSTLQPHAFSQSTPHSVSHSTCVSASTSPNIRAHDTLTHPRHRQDSHASITTTATDHRHYSFSASPALGPVSYEYARSSYVGSALTSPALRPVSEHEGERDLDQEATAALLMLNADRRGMDRRGEEGDARRGELSAGGRGMSVKDMLST